MHINLNLRGESRLSEANVEEVNISPLLWSINDSSEEV